MIIPYSVILVIYVREHAMITRLNILPTFILFLVIYVRNEIGAIQGLRLALAF